MRVALAHDYLTQRGGAERVALLMTRIFPGAPLYTSVYEQAQTFDGFATADIRTSRLQRIPAFRKDPRLALLALPGAWGSLRADDVDVVVASSTGWAHGISVSPGCRKVVYCHNPARWLHQPEAYLGHPMTRLLLKTFRPRLLDWDRAAAATADTYLVNSSVVAERVRQAYGIEPQVLPPPVMIDPAAPQRPVPGIEPGYWLTIARGRGYKNTQTIVEATRSLDCPLIIAGDATVSASEERHVTSVGVVSDDQLRWLYANARALVSVSDEDFGLTPLEANAFGTPVAVLRAGGFLDSTAEGDSGVFIEAPTAGAVRDALKNFPEFDRRRVVRNAQRFSADKFSARLREVAFGRESSGRRSA